jgi:hypothetical protein
MVLLQTLEQRTSLSATSNTRCPSPRFCRISMACSSSTSVASSAAMQFCTLL